MNKYVLVFVFAALLSLAAAQEDIQVRVGPIRSRAGAPMVGAPEVIDVNAIKDNEQEQDLTEAIERSKAIYNDGENSEDPLKEIVSMTKQIVAGFLFKITWETEGGNQYEVTVHMVPWRQGEARFPPVPEPIKAV